MIIPNSLIIDVFFMIAAIAALLLLSIYLYVRLQRSPVLFALQTTTILAIIALGFRFVHRTRLDPARGTDFGLVSRFTSVACVAALIIFIILVIKDRRRGQSGLIMPPDLSVLFAELDDVVLIYNRNNDLIGANKPELLDDIFPDSNYGLFELISLINDGQNRSDKSISDLACDITALDEYLRRGVDSVRDAGNICDNKGRHYLMRVSPISDQIRSDLGMIIILHDITREKELLTRIEKSNHKLERTCDEIEKSIDIEQKLDIEQQRMFLLQQIQNDMMEQLNNVLQQLALLSENEVISEGALISKSADDLRQIYKQVRKTVHGIHRRQEQHGGQK